MPIGVIFNFPGGTTEQYDEGCRELNDGLDGPPHRAQPLTAR